MKARVVLSISLFAGGNECVGHVWILRLASLWPLGSNIG